MVRSSFVIVVLSVFGGRGMNWSNVKRYLINYPYLSDYGQTIFCLSFPSRDRATAPGRFEYIVSFLIHPKRYAIRTF